MLMEEDMVVVVVDMVAAAADMEAAVEWVVAVMVLPL